MKYISTTAMYMFLAGRCAARRDEMMSKARDALPQYRAAYVSSARTFNHWMLYELKQAKKFA